MGNIVNKTCETPSIVQISKHFANSVYESPENKNKRLFSEIQKVSGAFSRDADDQQLLSLFSQIEINTCDEHGENLIHIFTKNCKIKIITGKNKNTYINDYYLQHLFDLGCDINKRDNLGKVPMCYSNNLNIDFFIKNGADLTIRDNENHTILYHLSKGFYISYTEPFVKNCPITIDYDEYIPEERLHKAILFRDINKVTELLLCEPNYIDYIVNAPYKSHTPLFIAGEKGFTDAFYLLLDSGATIYPSLLFDLIREYNFNHNKIQEESELYNSHIIIVQELIRRGTSINYKDSQGLSSLHYGMTSKVINKLLEGGADINARTESFGGKTLNHLYHIDKYFSIDADSLMYMTVYMPNIDVFRALFKYGADPNRKNENGHNAFMGIFVSSFLFIHYDTDEKYIELVKLFLDNGADLYIRDNNGHNVLDYLCIYPTHLTENIRFRTVKYLHSRDYLKLCNPKTMEFLRKAII